jgi:hypothetical protein
MPIEDRFIKPPYPVSKLRCGCYATTLSLVLIVSCVFLNDPVTVSLIGDKIRAFRAERWLKNTYDDLVHLTDDTLYREPEPALIWWENSGRKYGCTRLDFYTSRSFDEVVADYQRYFGQKGYTETRVEDQALEFEMPGNSVIETAQLFQREPLENGWTEYSVRLAVIIHTCCEIIWDVHPECQ